MLDQTDKPACSPLIDVMSRKKRQYDQRIRDVEHSTFTPLVLSTTGGMGRAATTFYRRLAAMPAERKERCSIQ